MEERKEREFYKERIKNIFDQMDDINKLLFWYKYISAIEER